MRFSVIVPTLGRPNVLRTTLESIAACDPLPAEVIVVDGDEQRSAEATTRSFEGRGSAVRYVPSERGLTRQRNAAMAHATGDVIVFFDDDVTISPNLFAVLLQEYSDPGVVGVTGRIVESHHRRYVKKHSRVRRFIPGGGEEGGFTRYGFPRRLIDLESPRDISFMHGSFMSARAALARSVSFDENLPGYGLAEDEDFSYRLARLGRIRYAPDVVVHHAKTGHATRDTRAFGRQVVVNRSYLFRKNFPQTWFARVQFVVMIVMLFVHRAINREWPECRGIADGAREVLFRRPGVTAAEPRVLFVSSHAKRGGSEIYLERLVTSLEDARVVSVVCLEDGPLVARLRRSGADTAVLPTGGGVVSVVASALRLRKLLSSRAPSLVHANGIKAALVSVVATIGKRVPVLWVKHDFSWDGRRARAVARRCSVVVGASAAVLEAVRDVRPERTLVIPIGIPPVSVDRGRARKTLTAVCGFPATAEIVAVVGRLHPVKGQADAVEIFARVQADRADARLVAIGGVDASHPAFEEDLRRRAEGLDVADAVAFLGHRDDAVELMAGCDVGMVPTGAETRQGRLREGFGLAAVEFMAVGTPVVAYDEGATREVIGSCGILVTPGDQAAAAGAIASLLDDDERRASLRDRGSERALKLFSLDEMVRRMEDLYRSMQES